MQNFSERRSRIIAALVESQLDAIVCSSSTEILLLTAYWPVMSSSIAVHTSNGDVRLIVPEDEMELAQKTSSAEVICYKPVGVETLELPIDRVRAPLAEVLGELGLDRATVGLPLREGVQPSSYVVSYQFRPAMLELLKQLIPGGRFPSCDDLLESLMASKTAQELAILEKACQVVAVAFARAETVIDAGLHETEVAAEMRFIFETAPGGRQFEHSYGYFLACQGRTQRKPRRHLHAPATANLRRAIW